MRSLVFVIRNKCSLFSGHVPITHDESPRRVPSRPSSCDGQKMESGSDTDHNAGSHRAPDFGLSRPSSSQRGGEENNSVARDSSPGARTQQPCSETSSSRSPRTRVQFAKGQASSTKAQRHDSTIVHSAVTGESYRATTRHLLGGRREP